MTIPVPGLLLVGVGGERICLDDPLGGGAFGDVFKAHSVDDSSKVYAVKFPRLVFGGSDELNAFLNEVKAAEELNNPYIVRVLHVETGTSSVPPYLVLEFIPDGTLQSKLETFATSGTYPPSELVGKWTLELTNGIAAVNSKMLHRDIKPDNILMDGDTPKLSDFGLSKIVDAITRSRTFKGRQHVLYMAPEAWRMETNSIQLDMYAMGIVFYQIAASLQYPYNLPSLISDYHVFENMHLFEPPKPLKSIRNDLPPIFYQVVSRLLEKRPQDRFRTWNEVETALKQAWDERDSTNAKSSSTISMMLDATTKRHEQHIAEQTEQERLEAERQNAIRLDRYQKDSLIKLFSETINEFNELSTLGKITETHIGIFTSQHAVNYALPYIEGALKLQFFEVEPPIYIRKYNWTIRYAGVVVASDGTGFNLLLCRENNDDLYGKWVVCRASRHALARNSRRAQPFGFSNNRELQAELSNSVEAMHVYVVKFETDVQAQFLELLNRILSE